MTGKAVQEEEARSTLSGNYSGCRPIVSQQLSRWLIDSRYLVFEDVATNRQIRQPGQYGFINMYDLFLS